MIRSLFHKYRHFSLFLLLLLAATIYFVIEPFITDVHIVHVPLDDKIPFLPLFVLPYVAWYVFIPLPMILCAFRDKSAFYRQCALLFPGYYLCLLFFVLYPTGVDFRPASNGANVFEWLCRLIYQSDRPINVFPSLHVYEALAIYLATFHEKSFLSEKKGVKIFAAVLTVLICLSTVFIKQHSAADVAGAIVLIAVIYFVYKIIIRQLKKGKKQC